LKIALVHEWLVTRGGAERCLEELCRIFPEAPVFTCFHDPLPFRGTVLEHRRIITTPLDRPPFRRRHRACLPLLPFFLEQWDFRGYDLVISAHHAVAKGIITPTDTVHFCWVHSPMRYAWHLKDEYLERAGLQKGPRSWAAR